MPVPAIGARCINQYLSPCSPKTLVLLYCLNLFPSLYFLSSPYLASAFLPVQIDSPAQPLPSPSPPLFCSRLSVGSSRRPLQRRCCVAGNLFRVYLFVLLSSRPFYSRRSLQATELDRTPTSWLEE
ncbi:hypothetical protein V2G26_001010 [Clonostachys chloroleuca]